MTYWKWWLHVHVVGEAVAASRVGVILVGIRRRRREMLAFRFDGHRLANTAIQKA